MTAPAYPEPTVGALIFNAEGKLFLMQSHKWGGQYCVPGGHIEMGETVEQAVKREVKEETGLDVRDLEFLCFQECIDDAGFHEKGRHFLFFDYACRTEDTEVVLNDEAEAYVWVSLDDAFTLPIERYTRKLLELYRERKGESSGA